MPKLWEEGERSQSNRESQVLMQREGNKR
jgi:hypothetical protein